MLAQYDTPDRILAEPADEFVARFVGADRSLKRLALRALGDVELEALDGRPLDGPRVGVATTLRDALAIMLGEGSRQLVVVDEGGEVAGLLSLDRVGELLKER